MPGSRLTTSCEVSTHSNSDRAASKLSIGMMRSLPPRISDIDGSSSTDERLVHLLKSCVNLFRAAEFERILVVVKGKSKPRRRRSPLSTGIQADDLTHHSPTQLLPSRRHLTPAVVFPHKRTSDCPTTIRF